MLEGAEKGGCRSERVPARAAGRARIRSPRLGRVKNKKLAGPRHIAVKLVAPGLQISHIGGNLCIIIVAAVSVLAVPRVVSVVIRVTVQLLIRNLPLFIIIKVVILIVVVVA